MHLFTIRVAFCLFSKRPNPNSGEKNTNPPPSERAARQQRGRLAHSYLKLSKLTRKLATILKKFQLTLMTDD